MAQGVARALVAALAVLAANAPAAGQDSQASIDLGPDVEYYDVSGTTLEALRRSLDRNALIDHSGMPAWALTQWNVDWAYQPAMHAGRCKLLQISASLTTRVTLPRWVDAAHAPAALVEGWHGLLEALEKHELGHVENGRAAEAAVARALSSVGSKPTCAEVRTKAESGVHDALFHYRHLDLKYDRDTDHGRAQLEAALGKK